MALSSLQEDWSLSLRGVKPSSQVALLYFLQQVFLEAVFYQALLSRALFLEAVFYQAVLG
jgi:hypothetical protein